MTGPDLNNLMFGAFVAAILGFMVGEWLLDQSAVQPQRRPHVETAQNPFCLDAGDCRRSKP